jgi:hypothetical protein
MVIGQFVITFLEMTSSNSFGEGRPSFRYSSLAWSAASTSLATNTDLFCVTVFTNENFPIDTSSDCMHESKKYSPSVCSLNFMGVPSARCTTIASSCDVSIVTRHFFLTSESESVFAIDFGLYQTTPRFLKSAM